jgi:NADPH:quinone reductase-like Zn-dependent oxidoreductase
VRYIEEGKIKSILHKTWKLSELHAALADFVSKNYVGKMAVVPDSKWQQVGAKHGG